MHSNFTLSKLEDFSKSATSLAKIAHSSKSVFETLDRNSLQLHAEHLYKAALRVYGDAEGVLQALHAPDRSKGETSPDEGLALASPFAIDVTYDPSLPCCRVVLHTPPILKKRMAMSLYAESLLLPLQQKVIRCRPKNFVTFSSASIVYVNHFCPTSIRKQPYYDNDNLAIKGILDALVPYLCVDDAAIYCDNFYLSQEDTMSFTEIFIMPKESFPLWMQTYQNLDFCKNLT